MSATIKYILFAVGVAIVIYLGYNYYQKKEKDKASAERELMISNIKEKITKIKAEAIPTETIEDSKEMELETVINN